MVRYLLDYKWFTIVYETYKKLMNPNIDETKLEKFFKRTIELIHELTEVSEFIRKRGPITVDLNYIKSLKKYNLTEKQKTIGSLYALRYICVLYPKNPLYKSVAERVKELIKKWKEGKIEIDSLRIELENILNYIEEKEKEAIKLNEIEFGIKIVLEKNEKIKKENIEEMSKEIYEEIKNLLFQNWNKNPTISREVSRKIREYLTKIRPIYNLSYEEFDNLHQEIFDFIFNL